MFVLPRLWQSGTAGHDSVIAARVGHAVALVPATGRHLSAAYAGRATDRLRMVKVIGGFPALPWPSDAPEKSS
jgi:hypothetical protein